MRPQPFWHKRKPTTMRVTDTWPLQAGPLRTTYGEMRSHATDMAEYDWRTPAEKGLADSILALLDDAERREQERRG